MLTTLAGLAGVLMGWAPDARTFLAPVPRAELEHEAEPRDRGCPHCRAPVTVFDGVYVQTLVHSTCAPRFRAREVPINHIEAVVVFLGGAAAMGLVFAAGGWVLGG